TRPLTYEEAQCRRDIGFHFEAWHYGVEHAVFEQEFAALEAFREFLPDGLLDDARSGEPDLRARLRDVEIAQHGVARGDAAGGGVGEDADIGQPGLIEFHQ